MKPAIPALDTLLATRQFFKSELFTLVLRDGTTLRYCSGDQDITFGGNVYSCGGTTGPYWVVASGNSGRTHFSIGLQTDAMVVDVLPGSSTLLGIPFNVACRYGILDGATLQRDIAIMATYGDTSTGLVTMFFGRIGEIDMNDLPITINVLAPTELLNQQQPRNLIQPGCVNTLFDASCTVNPALYQTNSLALAGSTKSVILTPSLGGFANYFTLGKIVFTSGVVNGEQKSIKAYNVGIGGDSLMIWPPLPVPPDVNTVIQIFPGCNKAVNDINGCPKFSNTANFRGFPSVPVVETAI